LVDIGQAAAASVVQILLALIVATAFWVSGDKLGDEVTDIAGRLAGETGRNAVMAAEGAVRGVAWGIVGTGIIQAMLMGIGLAIAGVPGVGVISFLTLIFSISQILGPLVVVGLGGVLVELMRDSALALAPVTKTEARELLGRLKGRAALEGFRGAPAADMDRLSEIIVRLSEFAADQRDLITELDVNPIIIAGSDAVAVDALIVKA
jgi:hypothetical protein